MSEMNTFYITLGIPFYMFGLAMNPAIRSGVSPKFALAATMIGQVLTAALSFYACGCLFFGAAESRYSRANIIAGMAA